MSFLKNKLGLKNTYFSLRWQRNEESNLFLRFQKRPQNILLSSYTTIILFSKVTKQN